MEEEEEEDMAYNVEYVEDLEESDDEGEIEDAEEVSALYERVVANKASRLRRQAEQGDKRRRSAHVEVEYETEEPEGKRQTAW